ncbi:hypothetical protein [Bradyrhizobium sp. CCGE-LA001]|uniref:hypothetical protein n=1 Tax=Bradyrhizobium sp. CCGE-LA001 TaxID=1223566 RepID=UPI0002AA80A1|nr:hypothetical protein [Bradyrhizobium sp. CCGE-LA001]AMA55720.1 hypothetical protein BCCGELA001_05190 [Bradyrhizobium sp. CCGE-LA001]
MSDELSPIKLKDFLAALNVPDLEQLPLVHTTESSRIFSILNQAKLKATPCNVFRGENLCYFFVGRPAYKFQLSEPNPYYWQLPMVFVVKFHDALKSKRILPFDSGAFKSSRLPSHILGFDIADFDLAPDTSLVTRLISTFYGSNANYFKAMGMKPEALEERHVLSPMHLQILSLAQLYSQPRTLDSDDRKSTIELQIEGDVEIGDGHLLGIILPDDFRRSAEIVAKLNSFGCQIEYYPFYPLRSDHFYYAIYDGVARVLKNNGYG